MEASASQNTVTGRVRTRAVKLGRKIGKNVKSRFAVPGVLLGDWRPILDGKISGSGVGGVMHVGILVPPQIRMIAFGANRYMRMT